jgi:hypothetical protein
MDVGNVADVSDVLATSIFSIHTMLRPKIRTNTVNIISCLPHNIYIGIRFVLCFTRRYRVFYIATPFVISLLLALRRFHYPDYGIIWLVVKWKEVVVA